MLSLVLAQHDFDLGPNMALILSNMDPNMAFILFQDRCPKPLVKTAAQSHVDLHLGPKGPNMAVMSGPIWP